jgi:hypothetical protein
VSQEVFAVIIVLVVLMAASLLLLLVMLARNGGQLAISLATAVANKLRAATRLPRLICLAHTLLNLSMVAVIFRGSTIIYGDGPNGFGELALKQVLVLFSLLLFAAATILHRKAIGAAEAQKAQYFLLSATSTSFLIGICLIFVSEAYGNDKGHCRNWRIASHSPELRLNDLLKSVDIKNAA